MSPITPSMYDEDPRQPVQPWSLVLYSLYLVALLPASLLAYIGIGWMDAYERGWRTQVAAASLAAAWIPLALGALFSCKSVWLGRKPVFPRAIGFLLIAIGFYAVAFAWGGRMLI